MPNDELINAWVKYDGADLRRANSLAFDAAKAFVRDDRTPMSTKLTAGTPGFLTALHDAILGAILKDRSAPTYEQGVAAGLEMAAKVAEEEAKGFLSEKYAVGQPLASFAERFACQTVASAIRALAADDVVGVSGKKAG